MSSSAQFKIYKKKKAHLAEGDGTYMKKTDENKETEASLNFTEEKLTTGSDTSICQAFEPPPLKHWLCSRWDEEEGIFSIKCLCESEPGFTVKPL